MNNKPIGIYDSGVGALAVLRTIQNILPNEKYIVYTDFKNAPYGEKSKEEIAEYANSAVDLLIKKGVKAVVVACNTATSAAVAQLRSEHDLPIIGMEPAIKPAAENAKDSVTIALATTATLKLMKFQRLFESLKNENIIPVACPGLATLIEKEQPGSVKIVDYLKNAVSKHNLKNIESVVIGCTHYSYIEDEIKEATGCQNIYDGRHGTARHLKQTLTKKQIVGDNKPSIEIITDNDSKLNNLLINDFLNRPLSFED